MMGVRPSPLFFPVILTQAASDLVQKTVDKTKIIPIDPNDPLNLSCFDKYDICITGAAMKQYESRPTWLSLVQNTWVYAHISPAQKELILTTVKTLVLITLMAGNGTNDVSVLKQAHIGIALLNGTVEDFQKIAEHQKNECIKKVYETQLKMSSTFSQAPPPVPPAIAHLYPDLVRVQQRVASDQQIARHKNPMENVCFFVFYGVFSCSSHFSALVRSRFHH